MNQLLKELEKEQQNLENEIKLHTKVAIGYYKLESLVSNLYMESLNYKDNSAIKLNVRDHISSQTIYFKEQTDGYYKLYFYNNKKIISLNEDNKVVLK